MNVDDRLRDRAAALHATEVVVPPFRQLRRMHRIRRSVTASTTLLAVLIVAAGAYAATGSPHAISVSPAGPPINDSSTTVPARPLQMSDIEHPTFAIFDQPPTRVLADRNMWLAARFAGGELWLSRQNPDSGRQFPQHCLLRDTAAGDELSSWCEGTGNALIGWVLGSTQGEFVDGRPVLIYGVVPDDVDRVTYAGRDVPVTNNVFVVTDPGPTDQPTKALPLFYFVGGCRIPMYVQGQDAQVLQDKGNFDPTIRCSP